MGSSVLSFERIPAVDHEIAVHLPSPGGSVFSVIGAQRPIEMFAVIMELDCPALLLVTPLTIDTSGMADPTPPIDEGIFIGFQKLFPSWASISIQTVSSG